MLDHKGQRSNPNHGIGGDLEGTGVFEGITLLGALPSAKNVENPQENVSQFVTVGKALASRARTRA